MGNGCMDDLAFERPEYDEAKVHVHIDDASAMTDQTFRC